MCSVRFTRGTALAAIRTMFPIGLLWLGACFGPPETAPPDVDANAATIDELLDANTDSHRDAGSDMQLLHDGPESYAAFVDVIESARDHLHVETLNFDDDTGKPQDHAREFASRFADKARAGVAVRMTADAFWHPQTGGGIVDPIMQAGGVDFRPYGPPGASASDQVLYGGHKKVLLADGRRAIIGGMNYGYFYFGENQWRDTNVLLTGPVVASIQREFLRDWAELGTTLAEEARYFPTLDADGPFAIRAIDQRPIHGDFDINTAISIGLQAAREHVDIISPYVNPTEWLFADLADAAARGVEIRILTNSYNTVDVKEAYTVGTFSFGRLIDSGVRILIWDAGRTLHPKAMVFDDAMALVGSPNLNRRSLVWDTENAIILTDPAAVAEVQAMIDADMTTDGVFEPGRDDPILAPAGDPIALAGLQSLLWAF